MKPFSFSTMFLLLPLFISCFSGCGLYRIRNDLRQLEQTVELQGEVIVDDRDKLVGVILLREHLGNQTVSNYFLRYGSGAFSIVIAPGSVYVFAFADQNENQEYDMGEPAAWYGGTVSRKIELPAGGKVDGLIIELSDEIPECTEVFVRPKERVDDSVKLLGQVRVSRGEVVCLDEDRFAREKGRQGLVTPVRYALLNGYGIFFLELYDPRKVPVLFVHGAGGCAQDFRALINHLDLTRFQPWIYQYPSGLRLHMSVNDLLQALTELHAKYRFTRMAIVAHSMGGLVTRSAINAMTDHFSEHPLCLFMSISTPWEGIRSAELGVKHSPIVIPVWMDVVPLSPFLKKLFEKPLQPSISYYLLFSVIGGNGTDGIVPLESEISLRAQAEAERIYGFPEDHMSILQSPFVIDRVNMLLRQRAW